MNFLLGIACGVATYQVLFKILGVDDSAAEALGWVVGIGFIVFSDTLIAYCSSKINSDENKMKLRIKELELQVQVLEKRNETKDKMSFFKKEKEL